MSGWGIDLDYMMLNDLTWKRTESMLSFFRSSILSSVFSSSSKLVSVSTAPVRNKAGVFGGSTTVPKIGIVNLNHYQMKIIFK